MSDDSYTQISAVRRRRRNGGDHRKPRPETNGLNGHAKEGVNGATYTEEPEPERRQERTRRAPRPETESDPQGDWRRTERRRLPYRRQEEEASSGFKLPFDPWRLLAAVKRNFKWIVGSTAAVMLLALIGGVILVKYKVGIELLRKQTPNAFQNPAQEQLTPKEYSDQTLFGFMRSGEVIQRVALKAANDPAFRGVQIVPSEIAKAIDVKPLPNPDKVLVTMKQIGELKPTVDLLNLYATEVVEYMREIQQREAADLSEFLKTKLAKAEQDVERLTAELQTNFSRGGFVDFDKETESDLKRLVDLKDRQQSKIIELESLDQRIRSRQGQLAEQVPANTKLQEAEQQLQVALASYTELHPTVIALKNQIAALRAIQEKQPAAAPTTNAPIRYSANNGLYMTVLDLESQRTGLETEIKQIGNAITNLQESLGSRSQSGVLWAMKKAELQSARSTQTVLEEKQRRFELLAKSSMGYFSVMSPATMGSVGYKDRWIKVAVLGFLGAMAGMFASVFLVLLGEVTDTTLKTTEDIARITELPVLASLGDLRKMSPAAQVNWAFRTLTLLRGKLSARADQALVCGIISSQHGEGRSTWVNLLVSAASQRGLRVLTVDTRPAAAGPTTDTTPNAFRDKVPEPEPELAAAAAAADRAKDDATTPEATAEANGHPIDAAANGNVLSPARVAEQLEQAQDQSVVHIPLPGWVWSLERRKQWQKALEYWKSIDNLVIFVELPPACESEAVLLAEHVPQVIWLVGSGMADAAETKAQLETLRHARANLVGAVLNYAPPPMLNTRIARWFIKLTSAFILSSGLFTATAATNELLVPPQNGPLAASGAAPTAAIQSSNNETNAPLTFSAAPRKKRAAWQERLTFGPGDTLDLHMYGSPALSRTNVFVGPDGRISYLQAQDVMASGLTVEELRKRLNDELTPYYTTPPQTIVIPVTFTSKKYYMLGKVAARGVYPLDRPLTVIEAVARARGLETGLYQRTTVEMADLSRSFLVREGKRLPVDLEKLFYSGDLSQNVALEPNDYLYFASAAANDIYVLGEVMMPGPIGFVPNATLITALTDRGGFTDKAYKRKVLVIRGSLNQPETFAVDSGGILDARLPDFKLQPRDIVFVSKRPWGKIEELADEAMQSFITGAVTAWAGVNIGPVFGNNEIIPKL